MKRRAVSLAAAVVAAALLLIGLLYQIELAASQGLAPRVIISEVAWAGTRHSAADEWIELYNAGDEAVALEGVESFAPAIRSAFNIGWWLYLVPAAVIVMIWRKVPALPALFTGTLLGALFAIIFQPEIIESIAGGTSPRHAYMAVLQAMGGSVSIETGDAMADVGGDGGGRDEGRLRRVPCGRDRRADQPGRQLLRHRCLARGHAREVRLEAVGIGEHGVVELPHLDLAEPLARQGRLDLVEARACDHLGVEPGRHLGAELDRHPDCPPSRAAAARPRR